MTDDLSGLDTNSLLQAAGLTPGAHPVPQPPPGPDLSGMSNDDLYKAAGNISVPIPPPDAGTAGSNSPSTGDFPTAFPGFQHGLASLYSGGVQLVLHALEASAPAGSPVEKYAKQLRDAMDSKIADDDAAYQRTRANDPNVQKAQQLSALTGQNVKAPDVGDMVGNVVGAAPLAAVAPESLPGRIVAGAATGALTGAAQPSTAQGADYWLEKAREATVGAVAGGAMAPLAGGAARIVKPQTSDAMQTLLDSGVRPTLGQLLGKGASRAEEGQISTPLIGDAIAAGRRGTMEDFNRATINQALAPIGEKLGADTPIGDKAINEMATKIGADRDALATKVSASVDPQFAQGMQAVMAVAKDLPPDKMAQFQKIMENQVLSKFNPDGTMDGKTFMEVQSTLGRMANDYMHSAIVDERYFGRALNEADDQLSQLLMRGNPEAAKALQNNNDAYAMLKRVQAASISSVKSGGLFTPAQLLQASKMQDSTLGHSAFARGSSLMKAYAQAGEEVLGSKVPDSGTAFRFMMEHPLSTLVTSPLTLPTALANTTVGKWIARTAMASRPSIAAPVSSGVRNLGGVFGGAVAGQAEQDQ